MRAGTGHDVAPPIALSVLPPWRPREMSRREQQLAQLERLARLKADRELRRFSAFRAQSDAMQSQIDLARDELSAAATTPLSQAPSAWAAAAALVGYHAGQMHQAEDALDRLRPGLDAARTTAARAFGRAEALGQLRRLTRQRDREDKQRKQTF